MDAKWQQGWQAGFDDGYNTLRQNPNQEVMDRSDLFQRGYREGLTTGCNKKLSEQFPNAKSISLGADGKYYAKY